MCCPRRAAITTVMGLWTRPILLRCATRSVRTARDWPRTATAMAAWMMPITAYGGAISDELPAAPILQGRRRPYRSRRRSCCCCLSPLWRFAPRIAAASNNFSHAKRQLEAWLGAAASLRLVSRIDLNRVPEQDKTCADFSSHAAPRVGYYLLVLGCSRTLEITP